jgi:hypothetical protein
MELTNSPRYSRLANVEPTCNFIVWDMSEVGCTDIRFDRCISRPEEGGVGCETKIVNARKPFTKSTPEFLAAV